eukprot:gnl/TRDRNA2_/TRDRNA2_146259_c1_seq3.p1 gnl/TRDRNA2_/TRDRNA2_146259_c1~~gnl/TRDRNA2_/TRDRNA2_146259_c1_seq3.p1  ORF type:complete len:823 (-),score=233.96 gnl/TRDRNA2_/TRDRNA2_146259_c1_seq3:674-2968(-)
MEETTTRKKAESGSGPAEVPAEEVSLTEGLDAFNRKEWHSTEADGGDDSACGPLVATSETQVGEMVVADGDIVDVDLGQMRLQGTFQGVATTHTHQLDLEVGLDVEMPSDMAAEAMKQIANRSRSRSREPAMLKDASPEPTMWRSLADFFRRDARKAEQTELQLKLKDHTHESKTLAHKLDCQRNTSLALEAQLIATEEEKQVLVQQLKLVTEERDGHLAHIEELKQQGTLFLETNEGASKQLADRDQQLSELETKLADSVRALQEHQAKHLAEKSKRETAEAETAAGRTSLQALQEKHDTLNAEVEELRVHTSGLQAQLQVLSKLQSDTPVEEQGDDAKQEALRAKVAELTEQLAAAEARRKETVRELERSAQESLKLQEEVLELRQLANREAAACQRLAAELDAMVAQHDAEMSESRARHLADQTAIGQLKDRELQLQKELREAKAMHAKPTKDATAAAQDAEKKALSLEAEMWKLREQYATVCTEREVLTQKLETFRANQATTRTERETILREHDAAKGERDILKDEVQRLQKHNSDLQLDAEKLRVELAATTAASEAAEENGSLTARGAKQEVEALKMRLKEFEVQCSSVGGLQANIAYYEQASADSHARHLSEMKAVGEARSQYAELAQQKRDKEASMSWDIQNLNERLRTVQEEAIIASQKNQRIMSERDKATKELRDMRQQELALQAAVKEERHAMKQDELRADANLREAADEARRLKRHCEVLQVISRPRVHAACRCLGGGFEERGSRSGRHFVVF